MQPGLFGTVDTRQAHHAAWIARVQVLSGWRCPHCGHIEPTDSTLGINHGFWEHTPDPVTPICARRRKD
ncbi:hypothetical protein [Hoyosella subflava]|uniref:hypothetical protein n=1 Tax=Hoyosella subflava TaxID=639313 RepID=UPI00059E0FCD|nr:hypothetical protein [Hoyosella subflava]